MGRRPKPESAPRADEAALDYARVISSASKTEGSDDFDIVQTTSGSDVVMPARREVPPEPLAAVRLQTVESSHTSFTDGVSEVATLEDEFHELWELQVGLLFPIDYDAPS